MKQTSAAAASPLTRIAETVRSVVTEALGASECRVLGFRRHDEGWQVDIEAYVRDPLLSIANAAGTKDVYGRSRYRCEFDAELNMLAMTLTGEG